MPETKNLKLVLTSDEEADSTLFKDWRNSINGETSSNMQKIDDFAGNTNKALDNKVGKDNVTASATSIDASEPASVTVTKNGNDLVFAFGIPKGVPGNDYVLTDADKSEIAALVLAQIPDGDEVAYG